MKELDKNRFLTRASRLFDEIDQLLSVCATEQAFAAVRAGRPVFSETAQGTLEQLIRLDRNVFAGRAMETSTQRLFLQRGETVLTTQFEQGAVRRGIDFASFVRTPEGIDFFLNTTAPDKLKRGYGLSR